MRSLRSLGLGVLVGLLLAVPVDAAVISVPADHVTIQAALDAAGPGDTIEVDSGVYGEKLEFPTSGSPGLPITLRAKPGAPTRPVLDGTAVPGANMILIDSKSHVAVVGVEIRNNLGVNDGSGVRVLGAGECLGDAAPDPFCESAGPGGASLKMRTGAKAQLSWRWGRGAAGDLADLGAPPAGADVKLCVYAVGAVGEIVLEAVAPAGAAWRESAGGGFKYKDRFGYPDGLRSAQLSPGDSGKAKLRVKGKGAGLPFGPLTFEPGTTVHAQLRSSAGGCYGSVFSPPFRRVESGKFQDASD